MLKAKFQCQQVNKFVKADEAHLRPVHGNSEENKTFSAFTPSGKLELMITNPGAFGKFIPGREYFIDISEVPE